jgi:hypothetical protein
MASKVRVLLFVPLFAGLLLIGCKTSPTPARVEGKVTYKGNLVTGGTITFHPVTGEVSGAGGNYQCIIRGDGTYSGDQMPSGDMVVTVETETINPNPKDRPKDIQVMGAQDKMQGYDPKMMLNKMKEMGKAPADAGSMSGTYVPIPLKYATVKDSPLKTTFNKGKNTFSPDLQD